MIHTRMILFTLVLMLSLGVVAMAATPVSLYVAPNGRDAWSGKLPRPDSAGGDGPLATLEGARNAVRRLRSHGVKGAVEVKIAGGQYSLSRPVVFGPQDGGADGAPVVYKALGAARPVFSGGRRISGFKKQTDGSWAAFVPEVAAGKWRFEQLWVNGRRAVRARTPNEGWFHTAGAATQTIDPLTGKQADLSARAFRGRPEDLAALKSVPESELSDVCVVAYQSWEISRLRVAALDAQKGEVVTTGPAVWPFLHFGAVQRYHLENFKGALDAPGEWFLDRKGWLFYRPLPGQKMQTAEVIAPVAPEFVRFEGTADKPVKNLELRGLVFQYGQYLTPKEGAGDPQAAASCPATVMADFAQKVVLADCELRHAGTYGVWFRRGCANCQVARCRLEDLGAGGVRIGETEIRPDAKDQTGWITVDNTIIHGCGRIHMGAVGVWIGQSGGNHVTHNDISDLFYTGVSVGWTWGYGPSLARGNIIELNRIHNIGHGVLSDMGGVYTLGISPGTIISHNIIHDVWSYDRYGRGGWGLYNDEGSTHIILRDNIVYNTKTGGYHQHYGRENLAENNVFAFAMDGQLQRSRVEDHVSFTFRHNIVYWHGGDLLHGSWGDKNVLTDHNTYWDTTKAPVLFEGKTLAQWQAEGHEEGSVVDIPIFTDPEHGDFRLCPGSPAAKIGFREINILEPGLYGSKSWTRIPSTFKYAPVKFIP